MGPLLPALLVALSPSAWAAEPCLDYYTTSLQENWEVSQAQWAALCKESPDPENNFLTVQSWFIEACLKKAMPSIQAGRVSSDDAAKLCAQGVLGRGTIPPAMEVPQPRGEQAANLKDQAGRIVAYSLGIEDAIKKGEVASLYGERAISGPAEPAPVPLEPAGAVHSGRARPRTAARLDNLPGPPAPDDILVQRALNVKVIQNRVVADEVSKQAADQARFIIGQMLANADPAVVQNLADRKLYTYIIPKNKDLTALAPFAHLKGTKTFDGRVWDKVRGLGSTELAGGGYALAAAEEELLPNLTPEQGYPENYILVHEFAHAVQIHGLPTRPTAYPALISIFARLGKLVDGARGKALERLALDSLPASTSYSETFSFYRSRMKKSAKSGLGPYADVNEMEFFAELTAAYFDAGWTNNKHNDLKLLMDQRPELAQLMFRVYGPAPSLRRK